MTTTPVPRLHAVTDDARLADARFVEDAAAVLAAGGVSLALHLRGRRTSAARLHELTVALLPHARAAGAKLLVNDRVDVALTARADGAHLPERSLGAARARALLGEAALIGVSRHAATIGENGEDAAADFVVFGSVYETGSHAGAEAAGLEALRAAVAASSGIPHPESGIRQPLIAIGGITPDRVAEVVAAGASGVAALSGIWQGGATAVAEYRAALESGSDAQ